MELIPNFKIKKEYVKPLMIVGGHFLVMQIAALVLFSTDRILLIQLFGPLSVTEYELTYRLFSLITITHGIVLASMRSAFTEAYHKKDVKWMREMLFHQMKLFFIICIVTASIAICLRSIMSIWIKEEIEIANQLIVMFCLYTLHTCWLNIFSYILNSVGKLRLSVIFSLFAMTINIPLSIFIAKSTDFGSASIILGSSIALLPGIVVGPMQVFKIIKMCDSGIWAK
jgi:O-antigen/teichoic acid export membrane protein